MMNERTCGTCIDHEDGFCDKKGLLVEEDDTGCEKWNGAAAPWKEKLMERFMDCR